MKPIKARLTMIMMTWILKKKLAANAPVMRMAEKTVFFFKATLAISYTVMKSTALITPPIPISADLTQKFDLKAS